MAAVSKISLTETPDAEASNKPDKSGSGKENASTPAKQTEKAAKDNLNRSTVKANAEPLCYWDVKGIEIWKSSFCYEFRAVTFKGEKVS